MPSTHRSIRARSWLVACTLLAAGLRAWDIAGQSLWSDEDITLDRARTALGAMLAGLPGEHAPLYFVLMRGWTRLAGDGDLALRYPSLLAGVLTVPLGYAVARRLTDRPTACAAALLLAVNPFLVSYGQEARMYALVGALTLAALMAALAADARARAGESVRARWLWASCGVLTAATVYTHYYGVLVAATLVAWGGRDVVRGWARAGGWLTAGAVAAMLFAPWLPRALRVAEHPGWRDDLPLRRVPDMLAVAWGTQTGVTAGRAAGGWGAAAAAISVGLLAVGVGSWMRRAGDDHAGGAVRLLRRLGSRRALLWLSAMALVAAIALLRKPDYHPRYLYPVLGVWFMAIAAGGRASARRFGVAGWLPLAVLVALWALPLAGYYADPAQRKTDYRLLVAEVLEAAPADQSRLFLDGPSFGIAERYVPDGADLKIENLRSEENVALRRDGGAIAFDARFDDLAHRRPNIWLATDGAASHVADGWLAANSFPVSTQAIGDITLARFAVEAGRHSPAPGDPLYFDGHPGTIDAVGTTPLPGDSPPAEALRPDAFGVGAAPITLLWSRDHSLQSVHAGTVLTTTMVWLPSTRPPRWADAAAARRALHVSIRLVAPEGTIVAHVDRPPMMDRWPTTVWTEVVPYIVDRHGLAVPASTPPGRYRLAVVLYDAETLAPAFTWSHVTDVTVEPAR